MNNDLMPFIWVAISFPTLIFFQRWIHSRLHGLSLILTGKPQTAVILYAIILFPGVFLHELSHWFTAKIFGVRTGSFSLMPKLQTDGTVQLGYVEYYRGKTLDPIRESLIGGAPLIFGTAVILLISLKVFDVPSFATAVQSGDVDTLIFALTSLINTRFMLIWIYLIFAVSNAMLPSPADRRAWPAFLIVLAIFSLLIYLLDLQTKLFNGLFGPLATIFGYLGISLSVVIIVDIFFMLMLKCLTFVVSRIKGVRVVYGDSSSGG